jgi:hypothetical protein
MHLRILKIYLFLFPLSIFSQQYGWHIVAQPPGAGIVSIDFVDSLYGWVYNINVGLMRTTDGGLTWINSNTIFQAIMRDIDFINYEKGWAIGTSGSSPPSAAIYKTLDSGKTWQQVYYVNDQSLPSGVGLTLQKVISAGQDKSPPLTDTAIIVKTTNGGNNFTITHYSEPLKLSFKKVIFTDELHGWIYGEYDSVNFGEKGLFLITSNGGETWSQQEIDYPYRYFAFTFLDSLKGWAWGNPSTFYKTNDGGKRWDSLFSIYNNPPGFEDIDFIDSLNGWAFGDRFYNGGIKEVIFRTNDGGYNWEQESIGLTYSANDGHMLSTTLGYAAALEAVLKYGLISNIEKLPEIPKRFLLRNNYPNPFNPLTTIEYEIPERSDIELKVFDILGKEIQTLVNQEQEAGVYRVSFNGFNLSSGEYFYRLKTKNYQETKQMILLK